MRLLPLVATAFFLLVSQAHADTPVPRQVDQFGDPLPTGAVKRLGKTRFANYPDLVFPSEDGKTIRCLRYGVYILDFDRATGRLIKTDTLPAEPSWEVNLSRNGNRVVLVRRRPGTPSPQVFEVWDLTSQELVAKLGPIEDYMWSWPSISPDGQFVVTTSEIWKSSGARDLRVRVWDADAGTEISSTELSRVDFSRRGGWVSYGTFSADGESLLYSCGTGRDSLVQCLDTKTLRIRWERHLTGAGGISGETPDGKLLLQEGAEVAAINLADGENCPVRLPPDFKKYSFVGFVNNGKTLLYTAGADKRRELKAWDWHSSRPSDEFRVIPLSPNAWASTYFSRDQTDVFISDQTWRLYDLKSGKPIWPEWPNAGHSSAVMALQFSADGKHLASAGADNTIRLWDAYAGRQVGQWTTAQPFPHLEASSPSCSTFGAMGPPSFDLNADGSKLVFASPGSPREAAKLEVVDTKSGRAIATKPLPKVKAAAGSPHGFGRIGFSQSGDEIVVVYGEADSSRLSEPIDKLARWNYANDTWRELGSFVQTPPAQSAWSRPSERLFVLGKAFDARTGKEVLEFSGALDGPLACSADERLVVGVGGDSDRTMPFGVQLAQDIRLWDAQSGALLARLPWTPLERLRESWPPILMNNQFRVFSFGDPLATTWPRRLAIHPTGRWLPTADPHGVRLWDALHEKVVHTFAVPFRPPIDQHCGSPATALAFSPDGKQLATGLPDGTILFWEMPLPVANPVDSSRLDELWSELVGSDAAVGWRAAWQLGEHPRLAVELARRKLSRAQPVSSDTVGRWIADLDSPDYRRRASATRQLESVADQVEPILTSAAKTSGLSPEARERVNTLLGNVPTDGRPLPPRAAGTSRAVAFLEHVNTAESRLLLRDLATGVSTAWLTREAKRAIAKGTK
jgi:WD40 repeat protein